MSEMQSHVEVEIGSERSFGIVFGVVFSVVGLYPIISGNEMRLWAIATAGVLVICAILIPKLFTIPNKMWFKLGMFLGAIVAPIVMALVFFLTVTPIGIIAKILRKDLLSTKIDEKAKSYWIKRDTPVGTMKKQF